eukprot:comp21659_c0_seq1/m.48001 comp21659_c0_seq1/g.48001  ORF comp21659_c0_seq1/g.48001 comp21659_c0_seq1/m.48001 type:complete len:737 (+) comp21659_c0_seq1:76-2286(+)
MSVQLPFLPGITTHKPSARPRKQFFTREEGVTGLKADGSNAPKTTRTSVFHASRSVSGSHGETSLVPAWLAFANQALRFSAYFKEAVVESKDEHYRVRKVIIVYHLEDNSISVIEPPTINSGAPSGVLLRRHRIALDNNDNDYYLPDDFAIGREVTFYGRVYRIVDCDEYTRAYYMKLGIDLGEKEDYPVDLYSRALEKKEAEKRRITYPKPEMDKKKQFLSYDKNVLEFYCVWKENRMFAEERRFKLDYFLADDQIQVVEIHRPNCGRDQSGPFLRKTKLLKPQEKGGPQLVDPTFTGSDTSNQGKSGPAHAGADRSAGKYYHWTDLKVGDIIDVLGRQFLIYDCDPHTMTFYKENLGIIFQPLTIQPKERSIVPRADPPYNGWGSEEDSLLSSKSLVPKPPKQDIKKMLEDDKHIVRFNAKLISRVPEDKDRDFVVSFFLADNTVSVFEPPKRNSGMVGGKFLERQRVYREGPGATGYYSAEDFYVGASVAIHSHTFILLSTDEFSLNVMESRPREFPRSNLETIHHKLLGLLRTSGNGGRDWFNRADVDRNGKLSYAEFADLVKALGERDISDQEIIHLMRYYDANGDGSVDWGEFAAVLQGQKEIPRNSAEIDRDRREHEDPLIPPHLVRDAIRDSITQLNESLRARRGQLLSSFRDFDRDRDGKLSHAEFRDMLNTINLAVSPEQKDQLVNHFFDDDVVRANGNCVTYQRFVTLLQRDPVARVVIKGINTL